MTTHRIMAVCCSILIAGVTAAGQQRPDPGDQSPRPAAGSVTTELIYLTDGIIPERRVLQRSTVGDRQIVVERIERPGVEGDWEPVEETVTDVTQLGSGALQMTRNVFVFFGPNQRRLVETIERGQEVLPGSGLRTVESGWEADPNGRLQPTLQRVEERRSIGPDADRTTSILLVPDINEPFRESERLDMTERRVGQAVVQSDSTRSLRDVNGRWQPTEVRRLEVRGSGSDVTEDETIERRDMSGALVDRERVVTRTAQANGREELVIETYSNDRQGLMHADAPADWLRRRVHRWTTTNADGSRGVIEEVEERNPVAYAEPMRVVQRTVATSRQVAADRWLTERDVYERDVNGRLVLVATETEVAGR